MKFYKTKKLNFFITLLLLITTAVAMERILVTGHYIGVDMMLGRLNFSNSEIDYFSPIFDENGSPSVSIRQQFCSKLAAREPYACGVDPTSADWAPDGCTNPLDTNDNWNSYFRPSCNSHDICYNYMYESQASCDDHFRTNMEVQCLENLSGSPGKTIDDCTTQAAVYYSGVQQFGAYFYDQAQNTSTCDAYHELRKKYCNG